MAAAEVLAKKKARVTGLSMVAGCGFAGLRGQDLNL
jgi:hypothetical protein